MARNVYPYFRLWDDVPEEERYGGAWVSRHAAEMRAQHPDQPMWQNEARWTQWARDADEEIERLLSRPERCAAAVLRNSTQNLWAPCPYRRKDGATLCQTHRRMAAGAAPPPPRTPPYLPSTRTNRTR